MRGPQPWPEEGASSAEIALLEASRRERAPASMRARVLGLAVAGATTATSTGAAATTAVATKGGVTVLTKILAISLLGGGIAVGGVVVRGMHRTFVPPSRLALPATPPAPVESSMVVPVLPAPQPSPSVHVEAPTRPARPISTDSPLSREVTALESAHQALADLNPDAALRLLDRYSVKFPSGVLSSEATVLRVRALLMRGDRAGAQALADSFSSAHPESPYRQRLQDLFSQRPGVSAGASEQGTQR
jgi:hypothetical protein